VTIEAAAVIRDRLTGSCKGWRFHWVAYKKIRRQLRAMKQASTRFFNRSVCGDRLYVSVRDRRQLRWGRRYTEALWSLFRPYADQNFLSEAPLHFHDRFWEMYLGVAFLRTRLPMRKLADAGPDFAVEIGPRRFWVEATAPSAGDGPDQVPEEQDDGVGIIAPTEKILLRFTHSLLEKQRQYGAALADGLIGIEDGYILGVNSRAIPHAAFGQCRRFQSKPSFPSASGMSVTISVRGTSLSPVSSAAIAS
jgi:hypothetical protein